ncbi:hypothetical protein PsW64_03358 [Pseudovibrio sp. W64]|nr:hypothetical protein PsW64_03358 [Pseudovibrio sp. W64]
MYKSTGRIPVLLFTATTIGIVHKNFWKAIKSLRVLFSETTYGGFGKQQHSCSRATNGRSGYSIDG